MVDAGLPGLADRILRAALARRGRPPEAIVLTHGHTDHAGSAAALANAWGIPIYAHPRELPFVTGRSHYPPPDPTVGGVLALVARVVPYRVCDLRPNVYALPEDGRVPGLPEWRWIAAHGLSPGHVALFRDRDRVLLTGDALTTVDLEAPLSYLAQRRQLGGPPAPFTCDWQAAVATLKTLAALAPTAIGAGHGRPMSGPLLAHALARFAATFVPPRHGRYVGQPAETDDDGIAALPPAPPDPLPRQLLLTGLAAGLLLGLAVTVRRRTARKPSDRTRGDRA
jgi:glyoxylase-like metal-dependent hydrolase (beta-lactamase superfamily II)